MNLSASYRIKTALTTYLSFLVDATVSLAYSSIRYLVIRARG
jgi:hypothetical protein